MNIDDNLGQQEEKAGHLQVILGVVIGLLLITGVVVAFLYISHGINQRKEDELVKIEELNGSANPKDEIDVVAERQKAREELLLEMKKFIVDGNSSVSMLREFYPEDVVFSGNGVINFIPINRELKLNDYKQENFIEDEEGVLDYIVDEQFKSRKIIDVSTHQGDIDWAKVKADGVEGVFIRLGFRGYETGKLMVDERYVQNIEGAIAAGLDVGVYMFTQAITQIEAVEEADLVLTQLEPYKANITLPVVLDVEDPGADARYNDLDVDIRTQLAITFLDQVDKAGYEPMIYGNTKTFMLMLDMTVLEKYPKWFASFNPDSFYFPYEFELWQYSESGRVSGIRGDVDMNVWPD